MRTPEFRSRFRHEVEAAARVSGEFTAEVVAADPDADQPWMATRYVAGPSLTDAVIERGPLPVDEVWSLAGGVARALQVIHTAGVVHRDLKPSNVVLGPDGPRVIDFGIARAADASALTGTGTVIGTAGFMSPEQVEGRPMTGASDVFSLGGLLHFAVTGASPFGEDTPLALMYRAVHGEPDISAVPDPRLKQLIAACLDKDPELRPTPGRIIAEATAGPTRRLTSVVPSTAVEPRPAAGPKPDREPERAAEPNPEPEPERQPEAEPELRDGDRDGVGAQVAPFLRDPASARKGRPTRRALLLGTAVTALTGLGVVAARGRGRSSSSGSTDAAAPSVTPSVNPSVMASARLTALAPRWTLTGHTGMVTAVAWSRGGRLLASGSVDRTVRIWDCSQNPPTLLHVLTGHEAAVTRLSFGAGTMLASVADWDARIWDAGTGTALRQLPRFGSFSGWQGDAVFSRTGSHLLRQSQTADVVVQWAVPSWKPTPLTFPGINAVTRSGGAVFTVDGGEVIGIDADSGLSKAHLSLGGTLYGADTSLDGSTLVVAAGLADHLNVWFCDLQTGSKESVSAPSDVIQAVAVAPAGDRAVLVGRNVVTVWSIWRRAVLVALGEDAQNAAWAPSAQQFATAGSSGKVKIWAAT